MFYFFIIFIVSFRMLIFSFNFCGSLCRGCSCFLFLFAVMMLNSKQVNLYRSSMKYLPAGFLIDLSLLTPVLYQVSANFKIGNKDLDLFNNLNINWYNLINKVSDIEVYGQVLYSYFVLQCLVAGLILLLVIIGSCLLPQTRTTVSKLLD